MKGTCIRCGSAMRRCECEKDALIHGGVALLISAGEGFLLDVECYCSDVVEPDQECWRCTFKDALDKLKQVFE